MVKYFHAALIALLLFGVSCAMLKSFTENTTSNSDSLKMSVAYQIDQDDVFQVFYTNPKKEYKRERSIVQTVKGNSSFQKMDINIPKGFSNIRLDIGNNENQNQVKIKELVLSFGREKKKITANQIKENLRLNPYIVPKVEGDVVVLKTNIINDKYDPFIDGISVDDLLNKKREMLVTYKVKKDDTFQIFFREKNKKFKGENSIKIPVKGSSVDQEIKVDIPPYCEFLRFDISMNAKVEKVVIKEIVFSENGVNVKALDGQSITSQFKPNSYITNADLIEKGVVYKTNKINNVYDPFLESASLATLFKEEEKMSVSKSMMFSLIPVFIFFGLLYFGQISITSEWSLLYNLAFYLILTLPFIQENTNIFETQKSNPAEKRKLADKPLFEFSKEYATGYGNYYKDHFGFRNELIHIRNHMKYKVFKVSTNDKKALIGKDSWFFYNSKLMQNFYTKHKLYKINELEKLCDKWGERKRVNAVNNIKYYKTFYPNKHSIYQEMMSNKMLLTIKDTISKTDQLIDYMGNCTPKINIVDYRSELLVAKSEAVLYRKQDTHWNNYGAFIAYEKLMKVVSKSFTEIKPKKIEDFNINWREEYFHTDLIGTMGLKWVKFKDVFPKFTLKDKNQNKIRNLKTNGFPLKTIIHENSAVENDLVVVVFRDSYTLALQQFFSLTFKKVYYIWTPYNQKIIDKVNPDLIIDGHVERDMEFK